MNMRVIDVRVKLGMELESKLMCAIKIMKRETFEIENFLSEV
jgi:hypothetical protein